MPTGVKRWCHVTLVVFGLCGCSGGTPAGDPGDASARADGGMAATPCGDACAPGTRFLCGSVTQGIEQRPGDAGPPPVCGCFPPSCPPGQFLIVSAELGTWCDGSPRGTASCASDYPP